MLTWTQQPDGWHANGFRIELAAPRRWLLLDDEREVQQVGPEERPLAVARTLTECKREAELLAAAQRRADLRKRHLAYLILCPCAAILLIGSAPLLNILIVATLATLATRSLGVITGTILWRSAASRDDLFYQ